MAYTYDDLLDDLKTRGMIPTGQNTFTADRFKSAMNAVMQTKILPLVIGIREDFYTYQQDFTINATGEYAIPSRAIGGKLSNLCLLNATERWDLPWISEEALKDTNVPPLDVVAGFYLRRNSVVLVPKEAIGYPTLQMEFFLRPGNIVENADAAQITAINTSTKTLTFSSGSIPTAWTTSDEFELVQGIPHFDTLGYELTVSNITSTTIVMTDALPDRLQVGDWISLSGETPVIQCPLELHPLLAQETANFCLRGQGDLEAYKAGMEEAKSIRDEVVKLLSPRVEKEGKKIVNRTGILRRGV